MAIVTLERRAREIGRIRMGDKGAKGNPQRLENFRLTSPDQDALLAAAARYGGEVRRWEGQPGQWELYITAPELPCMVAPMEVSQWYELWSGGGCQRRCDGQYEQLSGEPCQCDPEERTCKITTRLSVMLHELPGLGTWRLETHGYYAATELPGTAEILVRLAQQGRYVPAALAIEQREVKRDGKTKRFPVPVLRVKDTLAKLITGEVIDAPALPHGPAALPEVASAPINARPQERAPSYLDVRAESRGDAKAVAQGAVSRTERPASSLVSGDEDPVSKARTAYILAHHEHFGNDIPDPLRHHINAVLLGKKNPISPSKNPSPVAAYNTLRDAIYRHADTGCPGDEMCDVLVAARDRMVSA